MYIVHVFCHVKPDAIEEFRRISIENARNSIQEPGCARFDVIQQADDPTRFVLVEVYRDGDASAAHKLTPHYAAWREAVAEMMAEPRASTRFSAVFPPDDENWASSAP